MNIHRFENSAALVTELAQDIANVLQASINERGVASMAVSGGTTPKPLFKALSFKELPWQRTGVTLVDERWVADSHKDSNARLVRDTLLQNRAAKAHFVSLKSDHDSPFAAAEGVSGRVGQLAMPFDVVHLGMGEDGHTASFFPAAETLREAIDMNSGALCIGVRPPVAPHDRMTLTLPTLLNTRKLILHIEGESKLQTLKNAIAANNSEQFPICAVLQQARIPVDVYYAQNQDKSL